ncbi:PepSY-associated TM helix domain-containing protein [Pontibacter oryzae]|uniref:PepSY-associated TM helix domain-containing protein n=1 Tax=Pontibacter oryzae TaxID=2304593 RepID=UPI0013150542|nr:PepSY-associated TM helix domain-containing protein [Pontibacter oryzae]
MITSISDTPLPTISHFSYSILACLVPALGISVDGAMARVNSSHPEFEVTYVRFPTSTEGKLQFLGRMYSDPSYYGRLYSSIQVNYTSGEQEKVYFLREQPWLERFLTVLHPIHFGDYAGLFVQILYAIGGLMPGILSILGFVIWYYRQKPGPQRSKSATPRPVLSNAS